MKSKRAKILWRLRDERPFLLVGSAGDESLSSKDSKSHLRFVVDLYNEQLSSGRDFLHQGRWESESWSSAPLRRLLLEQGIMAIRGQMLCKGQRFLTGWCSNSKCIIQSMHQLCRQSCIKGIATTTREKTILAFLRGLKRQLRNDRIMTAGGIGTICGADIR